ncbi:endonuclease/exonuclease/phosphatase family protein [Cellulosilyticum sp. I15G10I2]|uniref:endonuclease/exonuclease/phosphatase family protein n=1 Tax=Cellulosilyticum sp. I15G10I2 TaxID=1892843 RepID=UPI00085C2D81|nr:endonuclease/exonuclease/phosphatase family protein [Cellulosilyticum sp. I15G10I2]
MKIMTFNVRSDNILDMKNRWQDREDIVYDLLEEYPCDILGMQEVSNSMHKDIEENVQDYEIIGMGRTRKLFAEKNSLLISKKHSIVEHETFWLSKTPKKAGSTIWYSLFPRICTTAIVQCESKLKVRVYNTHLDVLLPHAREYGLKKIGEFIEKHHAKEKLPCILMGDFNATPNSKVIQEFSRGSYMNKKFIAVQETDKNLYKKTTMGMFKGNQKGMHIDYIFVSEEFTINDVEILRYNKEGKYPSDHYPVIADVEI